MVVGLLGNESPDSNRFTLVTPRPENGVRLQAKLGNQNPTGLPVGAVRIHCRYLIIQSLIWAALMRPKRNYHMKRISLWT
ncbi:hypothetical protein ACTQ3A_03115 [Bilifractor sp. LCP21S3_F8]|uniref:hypothetical protein n=1 Tax=Bilifractor sp. LCP21S3_F8 TaxID=3438744 RepID=UPI003F92EA99